MESEKSPTAFGAEVGRLMDIIIHSLYSNREIFLRELISNAADASHKIRFLSLTNKEALGEGEIADLDIRIAFNKEKKTITMTDKGIGMTKQQLIDNLGTVARSGTTEFVENEAKEKGELALIGQFGVGFYSVYLVAESVTVVSKNNDDPTQHVWESTADGTFTVVPDPRGVTLGRGTEITLFLREDAEEFLDAATLERLVAHYSEFINFPILLQTTRTETREEPIEETEEAKKEGEEEKEEGEDLEVTEDEEEKKPKTKTVSETVTEWKRLNPNPAIWTRNQADITEEEYANFYKALTKDDNGHLTYIHFTAEGEMTFRSILYIPKKAEPGLYDRFYEKSTSLKLYVRRVLISNEFDDFLPRYLSFVKGIVDSEDLPLNVSRETLAQSRVLKVMGKKITRKVLEMLRKLADDEIEAEAAEAEADKEAEMSEEDKKAHEEKKNGYKTFWENFGKSIKLGLMDDRPNKAKLSKLLRFPSSKSDGQLISLEKYVDNMAEDQKYIYYITGASIETVTKSPFLERLTKKGYEVLYMTDPLDEYVVQTLTEFDGNQLQSVTKEGLKLGDEAKADKYKEKFEPLTTWLKSVYGTKVEKVSISNRLANSPCVLVTGQYGWSANMERIMKAQTFADASKQAYMTSKKTLEINPRHPMIKELATKSSENPDDPGLRDLANLLFDAALIQSGFSMENVEEFASRIHRVVSVGLDVDPSAQVEEEAEEPAATEAEGEEPEAEAEEPKEEL